MPDAALLLGGFVLLVIGGEMLVRGAVAVAEKLGMSPLLIGLILVGLGTSAPELVTSVQAALAGSPGIAIGNIVGSSISNILLILGLSALITPMAVQSKALRRDGVAVVVSALLFATISYFGNLDRITGSIFVILLAAYLIYAYRQEKSPTAASDGHTAALAKAEAFGELHDSVIGHRAAAETRAGGTGILHSLLTALVGLAVVVLGGKLLVDGAIGIARSYGMTETVIGLTIVAFGTSMPEFVTSVVAAIRKHADVALGNIMGSNIYNILGIGGATGLIQPTSVPSDIVRFDNLVMVAASVAMFAFAWRGYQINRIEGALLLMGYVAYIFVLLPA
ncbi:MAG: sodium:calcium antiporter [Hyphomicrobium sp. 32-62-53]|nr:MAG: sodium:calcium antiporter [Hyphomicrobium sp. 12-62-95]OYX97216.1 MAG: sodium:calcium antiporter [Hyphomicrobium sp. 32-62-53]